MECLHTWGRRLPRRPRRADPLTHVYAKLGLTSRVQLLQDAGHHNVTTLHRTWPLIRSVVCKTVWCVPEFPLRGRGSHRAETVGRTAGQRFSAGRTCERYEGTIKAHLLRVFGVKAVGAITVTDCEQFRANLLATRRPRTVRNVWQMLDRVLKYAYEHNAIGAVPADVIDRSAMHYAVGDDTGFEPHPLTAPQVAALAAKVGERYPVYELLVLFMAYTGLRAAEVRGLEVRDLVLTTGPGGTKGVVRVQRTKSRRRREWVTGTPKSKTSKRTVPLPPWLAMRMANQPADPRRRRRPSRRDSARARHRRTPTPAGTRRRP